MPEDPADPQEDTYTEALSTIITRDFFPNLPHLHATNAYLSALKDNDPELLSASIRRLAAIARAKEGGNDVDERVRELENIGTPYMNVPGRGRTPIGARGWDTPVDTRRREAEAGPSRPAKKVKRIRDDLSLDTFQANYTSEDNASFVQIVDAENRQRKEERWGWAWDAEKKAEQRRIEGEEQRKMILEAATSGRWMVDANGKRLIGGLAEGGRDRAEGEAWKDVKMIAPAGDGDGETHEGRGAQDPGTGRNAVVLASTSAMVKAGPALAPDLTEAAVPEGHPLQRALVEAGLPSTALISVEDGAIVPHREFTAGEGDGRGRGESERIRQDQMERSTMGEEESNAISLGGSGADQWPFKVSPKCDGADVRRETTSCSQPTPTPSHTQSFVKTYTKCRRSSITRILDCPRRRTLEAAEPAAGEGLALREALWMLPYGARLVGGCCDRADIDRNGASINSYPLVSHDASPSPSDLPSLLTWGTLLATPRAIDGGDDPLDGPSFALPESKRRDEIGRRLGDKASRSMNERAKGFTPRANTSLRSLAGQTQRAGNRTPGGMAPPATPRRQDNLTPAAQRLLVRSLGTRGGKSAGASWASTPGR